MTHELTTDKAARATLYRKISKVTAAVGRIAKNGRNEFHKYNYATESDITDGLRALLEEHGLAFLPPSVIAWERDATDTAKGGPRTRVQMEFAIACCDTGELYTAMVWGEGQDSGDKGFYKAYTGAVKYFLMKTFLIATGDDPEHDTRPPARNGSSSYEPRPPAAPVKPATKRPINREQLIERFRKAQGDAAALGLNYAQYRPEDMSDADMIRVGTEIKEAIAMETTTTPALP